MPKYLVAIHRPDDYDAAAEDAAMHRDIDRLNQEMVEAGVRLFVGGLQPPATAQAVRRVSETELVITDGPYVEAKEHMGGFWVLEAATQQDALEWGRKAATACRAPVEVRPF